MISTQFSNGIQKTNKVVGIQIKSKVTPNKVTGKKLFTIPKNKRMKAKMLKERYNLGLVIIGGLLDYSIVGLLDFRTSETLCLIQNLKNLATSCLSGKT
jgi:hypothetical protein